LVENGTIPVELTSFTATVDESTVQLSWTTSTENNNSRFEILRFAQNDKWERMGFVEGQGTTTKEKRYSFVDKNLKSGRYQYRLKQIDYDGSFEYSDIVEVEIIAPSEFSPYQNYPNPFNPSTTIKYSIPESGNVKLEVYNSLGEKISTLVDEFKNAGTYQVRLSLNGLSSGVYFYRLRAEEFTQIKKMLLIR
jgi:hypothetical protein